MKNANSFGKQASVYSKGRPGYPPELYGWIAENSPGLELVWDVGTGSGQAAWALTAHFDRVHATDISAEQVSEAKHHPQITYQITPAQNSGLVDTVADAVCVATAVHWFADEAFWAEVSRTTRDEALFCAWTYQLPKSTTAVHAAFLDPVYKLIDPYWAEGNRICMAGYSAENLNCPFPTLTTPEFDAGGAWTAQQLVAFAKSWSAYFKAKTDGKGKELESLAQRFLTDFNGEDILFEMPISVLAARL